MRRRTQPFRQIDHSPTHIRQLRSVDKELRRKNIFFVARSIGVILLLLVCTAAVIRGVWLLRVQNVECVLEDHECPPTLYDQAQMLRGTFIFANVSNPIKGYSTIITRQFPNTIIVTAKIPLPVIILSASPSEKFLITSDGYVLKTSGADDLLPETIDRRLSETKEGDQLDRKAVDFYKELKSAWTSQLDSKVSKIEIENDDSIIMALTSDTKAILRTASISAQLTTLQDIFSAPTIDVRGKEIDVRFRNPVIRDV